MKIRIFTDGSCLGNPGPGGWAVVFNAADKCEIIAGNETATTNNRMELKSIVEAFKNALVKANDTSHELDFELYSDSAYAVNSINNGWVDKWQRNRWKTAKNDNVKNKDLWEEFTVLKSKVAKHENIVGIKIIKIKGHAGNTFNELVDKLAKEESMKAKEGACGD